MVTNCTWNVNFSFSTEAISSSGISCGNPAKGLVPTGFPCSCWSDTISALIGTCCWLSFANTDVATNTSAVANSNKIWFNLIVVYVSKIRKKRGKRQHLAHLSPTSSLLWFQLHLVVIILLDERLLFSRINKVNKLWYSLSHSHTHTLSSSRVGGCSGWIGRWPRNRRRIYGCSNVHQ